PAPATTSAGRAGAAMTAACSSVGGGRPSAAARTRGVSMPLSYPSGPTVLRKSWSGPVRRRVDPQPVDLQGERRRRRRVGSGDPVLLRPLVELHGQVHGLVRDDVAVGDPEALDAVDVEDDAVAEPVDGERVPLAEVVLGVGAVHL